MLFFYGLSRKTTLLSVYCDIYNMLLESNSFYAYWFFIPINMIDFQRVMEKDLVELMMLKSHIAWNSNLTARF